MKSSLRLINLGFLPRSFEFSLLFLRLATGLSMFLIHGWSKIVSFPSLLHEFPDTVGLGRGISLAFAIFTESVCSLLLTFGILTRFAAALLLLETGLTFFRRFGAEMSGAGEASALYAFALITILIAGGGRYSADAVESPAAAAGYGALAGAAAGYPLSYYLQGQDYQERVPLHRYIAEVRGVLADGSLKATALITWTSAVLLCALAGYFIGRAMNRTIIRQRAEPRNPALAE